jgi:hypothetical protein
MKPKSTPYFLLLMLVVFLASCSKKAKVPVPEDAAIVIHIDGASLSSKLSWDEIKQGELYKLASAEIKDETAKKILDNPETSGIDIKSDAFLFIKVRGNGGYVGFTCEVKDEKALTTLVTKVAQGKAVTKEGELSVLKDDEAILTWNSDRLVMIADNPSINTTASFGGASSRSRRFPQDSLLKFANEVYTLKAKQSVTNNDKFADMMKQPGDAHYWINSGAMYGNSLPAMLGVAKISLLFEGNYTATTLNFDNGKITMEAKSYLNKEMEALYKKHNTKNLDDAMLKKIPGSVAGVMAMNYPPDGLKDFLAMLGVDGLANMYLQKMGYSIEDFIKANKGDLVLAASDFAFIEKEMRMGEGENAFVHKMKAPDVKVYFATSVNDNNSFQKLIDLLQQQVIAQAPEQVTVFANKVAYTLKDNWFIAGNDSSSINNFGAASVDHPFISKISGHPMGGFIDIQKILTALKPSMENQEAMGAIIADESLKVWQDIVFYGGEYKDDAVVAHFEINMMDKTTNSLKQLHNYLGQIAKTMKAKEDAWKTNMDMEMRMPDSTVKTVPEVK